MLVSVVLSTVALLILTAIGQIFPTRVFLGRAATRQKVANVYGIPAAIGFLGLMIFGPNEKPESAPEATTRASAAAVEPMIAVTALAKPTRTQQAEEKGQFLPLDFEGFKLPGRMADAKAAGFTDCTAGYDGYQCKQVETGQLLGVAAQSATLVMDARDYFVANYLVPMAPSGDVRQLPAEKLAYGEVSMTFAAPVFDEDCTKKNTTKHGGYDRPVSCVKNKNTTAHLSKALADGGWVQTSAKGGHYTYVHPDEAVQIGVHNGVTTIRRITRENVKDIVARHTERRTAKATAEANAANVLEQMKK